MKPELQPLVRPLSLRRSDGALWSGALGAQGVVAAITGIGTGPAADAAERVLDLGVRHVVVVGVAGGIGPSVAIGDLVVPERVLDLESGAEHRPAKLGSETPRGTLVTCGKLVTDLEVIGRLERAGAVAIDMETSAVAAVCERRGCPWSVFRAISDRADDGSSDPAFLALGGPDGSGDPAAIARFLLRQPWRVVQLARLGRGLHLATRCAARAAVRALASAPA
jgi:nucleoside phosphorylase